MTTINTPTGWDEKLKSRLEGLTDEQKDQLLELLMEDKKLREDKREWKSEKLINSELKYFDKIISKMETLKKGVDTNINNYKWGLYVNSFKYLLNSTNDTLEDFNYIKDEYRTNKDVNSSEIRADIKDILTRYGLSRSGWVTKLMTFISYSRIPNLKDQMKKHWIDVSLLESICSDTKEMLNEIGIEVIVPSVLTDTYDINLYEYKNDDTWIDRFFQNISKRDYKWYVYDIIQVGYIIKDEKGNIIESKKPTVYYD